MAPTVRGAMYDIISLAITLTCLGAVFGLIYVLDYA